MQKMKKRSLSPGRLGEERGGWGLTLPAVKVNMGRKMMASLASGILVQTAARTVMMAPD